MKPKQFSNAVHVFQITRITETKYSVKIAFRFAFTLAVPWASIGCVSFLRSSSHCALINSASAPFASIFVMAEVTVSAEVETLASLAVQFEHKPRPCERDDFRTQQPSQSSATRFEQGLATDPLCNPISFDRASPCPKTTVFSPQSTARKVRQAMHVVLASKPGTSLHQRYRWWLLEEALFLASRRNRKLDARP